MYSPNFKFGLFIVSILFLGVSGSRAEAQNRPQSPAPNVYLDCNRCSFDYVRLNIDFVNYVRDQADADIYLRITDAQTGSGREYTLEFRGIPPFSERLEVLTFTSLQSATSDEERTQLMRYIRVGLVPFLTETIVMQGLDVSGYSPIEDLQSETQIVDPWNNWVFEIDLATSFDKEETEFNYEIEGGLEAERITENWKMDYSLDIELDRTEIDLSSGTRYVNRDSWSFDSFVAYSIRRHFSIGLFTEASASKTDNILVNLEASPAIEYSFFPYNEFQERRWVLQYRITPSYRNYDQTTVFLKNHEIVSQQVLSHQLRFDQPWGRIDIWTSASSYLHDLSLNRFQLNPYFSIRITRGLSVFLNGRYQIINDQISLPAEDITDTERLLGERQQATSYEFWLSFGFSYTFGSAYSNIVNPRF
ncbi:MAG: hypothetical protein WEA36_09135 [Balneolaceae bacterium]